MTEEMFETFDDEGRPTGLVPRSRVHREGLWHRAANVFLFRSDGRLLIQRRQPDKDVWPGAWDLSVGEHLKPGESYESAASRGLSEELGVEGVSLEALGGVARSRVEVPQAGVRDYELQRSYRAVFDGPITADPGEVAETRLIELRELAAAFAARPEEFTPWFRERAGDAGLLAGL
jgi:isopentenyl-diphosphate delta-isomerase type 1